MGRQLFQKDVWAMKNILKNNPRVNAYITRDGREFMVVAVLDVSQEEINAAIAAEEELNQWRIKGEWN